MQTIHELLSRIRWDAEFGRGEFVIGYYDRMQERILQVPLRQVWLDANDRFFCQIVDEEGELHSVPFHRIREVYKNGAPIWRRPPL